MKTNKTHNTLLPKTQPNKKKNTTQNPRIFYSKLLSNWFQITTEDQVSEKINKDLKVWSISTKYYCNGKNVGKLREVLEMYLLPNKIFTWNQMINGSSNKLIKACTQMKYVVDSCHAVYSAVWKWILCIWILTSNKEQILNKKKKTKTKQNQT